MSKICKITKNFIIELLFEKRLCLTKEITNLYISFIIKL